MISSERTSSALAIVSVDSGKSLELPKLRGEPVTASALVAAIANTSPQAL